VDEFRVERFLSDWPISRGVLGRAEVVVPDWQLARF
jgi:hypothetical protein